MWITLLFIAQIGGEWVQISQQHYRKPYRPYNHPILAEDADFEYEEDTTPEPTRIYVNQSMSDYKWKDSDLPYKKGFVTKVEADHIRGDENRFNKDVHRINANKNSNVDHSEEDEDVSDAYIFKFNHHRQDPPNKETVNDKRATISHQYPEKDYDHSKQEIAHHNPKIYGPASLETEEDVFEESYHIIPSIGSIKRVHLDSRTVRTPIIKEISKKDYEAKPTHNQKPPINENYNINKETIPRPILVWKNDNQTKKIVPGIIQKVSKEDLIPRQMKNNSKYEEIILDDKGHSKIKDIFMQHVVKSNEGVSGETVQFNQLPDINFEKPVFVTKEEFDDEGVVTIASDVAENIDDETTQSNKKATTEIPKPNVKHETEETSSQEKVNTMENVLKFMKIVTDTISRNTRRSVGSKVRYLENLQDTIMSNIELRINTIWPDDVDEKTPARKARSAATPRGGGHVEFPSSESALMTISFLTFAVYLIKLVLQVIHTYKNKAMMLTPAVVTAVGRNVAFYRRADNT